jgi:PhzF family phenazine biosynthesis protein
MQVDAFTGVPFSGNPAAVCLLPSECQPLEDATRQAIAAEMNLSETAFVEPVNGSGPRVVL